MKKLTSFLLVFFLVLSVLVTLAVPAFAAEKDFKADYFPSGKLETPEAPYIKETQFEGQETQLAMYYYQTADLQKLALDIQKQGDVFYEQYGIAQLSTFIQIDVKFNDGEWLSKRGKWDELNEDHEIDYGENIDVYNLNFSNIEGKGADNADKLLNFTQSWLVYFEADNPVNDYFKPFIRTAKNEYDGNEYFFDFENVTITYRIRWCVKGLIDEYTDNEKWLFMTSDWSPETSYGKNGKQEELKMPEKLDAPVLSEFELKANEDGSGDIQYFVSLPDSIYEAARYQNIIDDVRDPYALEAQIKIGNSDWQDSYVSNNVWLNNGYRVADGSELSLKVTDNAWIRVRVVSTVNENEKTEWSNIIGTKAIEGADDSKNPEGNPSGDPSGSGDTEKTKCKVCGICPIQPLNICLFIWLAILLVVVIVIVVAVTSKKNKDGKRKQNR